MGKVDLSGLLLACDGKAQCRLQEQERGAGRMTMHSQDWWQFGQFGGAGWGGGRTPRRESHGTTRLQRIAMEHRENDVLLGRPESPFVSTMRPSLVAQDQCWRLKCSFHLPLAQSSQSGSNSFHVVRGRTCVDRVLVTVLPFCPIVNY